MTLCKGAVSVNVSKQTIFNQYARCRGMRTSTESIELKMCGTADQPIQLDESQFDGRWKYNRGKLRSGDDRLYGDEQARHEMEIEVIEAGSVEPGDEYEEFDDLDQPTWPSSHWKIVIGPWVAGL